MEIEPTYVTFEQAKWLKDKNYEIETEEVLFYRDEVNNIKEHQLKNRNIIYNGTSINHKVDENEYRTYHQWEFVEWLRVKHSIFVFPEWQFSRKKWLFNITKLDSHEETIRIQNNYYKALGEQEYDSPQESYSAAFDYVLNNNLI
jgi:hypothetical protein